VVVAAAAAVVWAPSVHNTQPWRLSEQEREICVHAVARSRLHRLTYKCQGLARVAPICT
jgi:hypothetical protein